MGLTLFHRKMRWMACATALTLGACAASTAQELPAPRPALWKVADEDTTIYLFGTIHLLPAGLNWRTPTLENAIKASGTLVLEIPQDDPMAGMQAMQKLAVSPNLPPLAERVPLEKREALAKAVEASGIPAAMLDKLETWAASLVILSSSFTKLGLDPALGAEKSLEAAYKADGKTIDALETVEQQLGFFDKLSEESQRAVLVSAVEDPETTKAQFKAMVDAWTKGDVDAIARTFDDETSLSAELREVLMKRRNARWAEWVDKRLEQPGTLMVAVGAGHLAGPDSVQKMLEAKGLKAIRVQ